MAERWGWARQTKWPAVGQELAGTFAYDVHRFEPTELVARIADSRPDVLFVSAYLDDGVAIRRATIDAHLPLRASIGTSSSYCMPSFAAKLGPGAVGLFASDKPDAQVRGDALSEEGRRTLGWAGGEYRKRFAEPMSAAALAGFANTWALVGHVLPAASGFEPEQVAAAARATKLAQGTLANGAGLDLAGPGERDAGENRKAVSVIWQWVDARTQVVVWPPAFANHPLGSVPIQT